MDRKTDMKNTLVIPKEKKKGTPTSSPQPETHAREGNLLGKNMHAC